MSALERIKAFAGTAHAGTRVAIVMLFLGGVILVSGYEYLLEWSALQPILAIVTLLWVGTGLLACGSALWLLSGSRGPGALWLGAAAAAAAGLTLAFGVLTHVVPCPGPTCVLSRLVAAAGLLLFALLAPKIGGPRSNRPAGHRA